LTSYLLRESFIVKLQLLDLDFQGSQTRRLSWLFPSRGIRFGGVFSFVSGSRSGCRLCL
jgi:hypothetical protein